MDKKQEELERNNRIKAEFDRLKIYFEDLPKNENAVLMPLIQNASFMKITLEDLQELIQREGVIDSYQNGEKQHGLKQSAALQSYNQLIKNYAAVIKNLFSYLPFEKQQTFSNWAPREKTEAEREDEARRDAVKLARINAEIKAAAEQQRRELENRP